MPTRKVVVIDTNLFISAIIHSERTCGIGLQIAAARIDIAVSHETQAKLLEVHSRSYLDPYASQEDRQMRTLAYLQILKHFEILEEVTDCKDAKDNMFLSHAKSAKACVLVSGDKRHLIKMNPDKGLPIMTMRKFVDGYHDLQRFSREANGHSDYNDYDDKKLGYSVGKVVENPFLAIQLRCRLLSVNNWETDLKNSSSSRSSPS